MAATSKRAHDSTRSEVSRFGHRIPPLLLPPGWRFVIDSNEAADNHLGYPMENDDGRCDVHPLAVGDYSISDPDGRLRDDYVVVERKTLANLKGDCSTPARERWEAALLRLREVAKPLVVIEANWRDIAGGDFVRDRRISPKKFGSKIHPNAVVGSVIAWCTRHRIPFLPVSHLMEGERVTRWVLAQAAAELVAAAARPEVHE